MVTLAGPIENSPAEASLTVDGGVRSGIACAAREIGEYSRK